MHWRHALPKSALAFFTASVFLVGCEGKLAGIGDMELQDKIYQCNTTADQSPGFAISCDNYRRECERRRDKGRFVC